MPLLAPVAAETTIRSPCAPRVSRRPVCRALPAPIWMPTFETLDVEPVIASAGWVSSSGVIVVSQPTPEIRTGRSAAFCQ